MPDAVDFTLAVESELAKQLDFNEIIETFANKKARKLLSALPSIDNLCRIVRTVCLCFFFFFNLLCTYHKWQTTVLYTNVLLIH